MYFWIPGILARFDSKGKPLNEWYARQIKVQSWGLCFKCCRKFNQNTCLEVSFTAEASYAQLPMIKLYVHEVGAIETIWLFKPENSFEVRKWCLLWKSRRGKAAVFPSFLRLETIFWHGQFCVIWFQPSPSKLAVITVVTVGDVIPLHNSHLWWAVKSLIFQTKWREACNETQDSVH